MSLFDRVRDTSTTTGTGSLTLSGTAPTGFRTFGSVFANNDRVYYAVAHQTANEWETGFGTYSTTGPALARTVVLASSNAGAAVNFSAGTKDVFCTAPAAALDRTLIVPGGRLTTESGVPVSTSDRTAQGTLYYTPYTHNQIHLFNGSVWRLYSFTERSLALSSLTSGLNYDVFLWDNSGTLTLELTGWTNDTTRATALTTQDGVLVRSGATTRRYLGTIRTTGAATTEDSAARRFVWNAESRLHRPLRRVPSTATWTYGTTTWRAANNDSANRVELVCGVAGGQLDLFNISTVVYGGAIFPAVGIDEDGTSANDATLFGQVGGGTTNEQIGVVSLLRKPPAVGYHFYTMVEFSSGTATFTGTSGSGAFLSGLSGGWPC